MGNSSRRIVVTIPSDHRQDLDDLKKEEFHDDSEASMLRYVISRGLEYSREKQDDLNGQCH